MVPEEDRKLSMTHAARSDAATAGMPDVGQSQQAHSHDVTSANRQMKAEGKGQKPKAKAKGRIKGRATHAHLEMRHI